MKRRMVIAFGCDDMEYRTTVEMSKNGVFLKDVLQDCAQRKELMEL